MINGTRDFRGFSSSEQTLEEGAQSIRVAGKDTYWDIIVFWAF
jgi:hypothetical protein